jgi:hypothetical protein
MTVGRICVSSFRHSGQKGNDGPEESRPWIPNVELALV